MPGSLTLRTRRVNRPLRGSPLRGLTQAGAKAGCLARALFYLAALAAIMFFFALIPEKETQFTRFGSKTLNVYLLHGFIIIYTKSIGLPACIDSAPERLLLVVAALGLTLALASAPVAFVMDRITNPLKLLKKQA